MSVRVWCGAVILCCLVASLGGASIDDPKNVGRNIVDDSVCSVKQFLCANRKCVPMSWVCDEVNDCGDNSDETLEECNESHTCTASEFRCKSGRCVPLSWRCDNEKDCADGSDEDPNICKSEPCTAEEFTCGGHSGECVPLTWMCDDNPDCSDGSDEKACSAGRERWDTTTPVNFPTPSLTDLLSGLSALGGPAIYRNFTTTRAPTKAITQIPPRVPPATTAMPSASLPLRVPDDYLNTMMRLIPQLIHLEQRDQERDAELATLKLRVDNLERKQEQNELKIAGVSEMPLWWRM